MTERPSPTTWRDARKRGVSLGRWRLEVGWFRPAWSHWSGEPFHARCGHGCVMCLYLGVIAVRRMAT